MEIPTEMPFVGLRPFREDESDLFFGREKQIVELMEKLHVSRFIGVIGSSGCGKSSLIKAGLIPKLKAGFLTDERDFWITVPFRPADDPLKMFTEALNTAIRPTELLDEKQVAKLGATYMSDFFNDFLKDRRSNVLILVDQFEELFTIERTDEEHINEDIQFVNLILALSRIQELPIYVIITMRSEYIGKCNKFYGLPEILNRGQYLVPRLNRQQLKQVIELPVKLFGFKISARLVDILLNESDDKFDQLPVLQHCLLRTFLDFCKSEGSDAIDLENYNRIGKYKDALSVHADSLFAELSEVRQGICVQVFKALSTVNYEGDFIRRPQTVGQLRAVARVHDGYEDEHLFAVLRTFSDEQATFLMISLTDYTQDPIVDISHESLLKYWVRLSEWIRDEATCVRKLNWLENNVREKRELLRGIDLKDALAWQKIYRPSLLWARRYHVSLPEIQRYIDRSRSQERAYIWVKRAVLFFALVLGVWQINKTYDESTKLLDAAKAKAYLLNKDFYSFYLDSCVKDTVKKVLDLRHYNKLKEFKLKAFQYFYDTLSLKAKIEQTEKAVYFDEFKSMNLGINNYVNVNLIPSDKHKVDVHSPTFMRLMQEAADRARENVVYVTRQLQLDQGNIKYNHDLSVRYGNLSYRLLFIRQFDAAVKAGEEGLRLHKSNDWILTDIALGNLLNGNYKKADSIYRAYGGMRYINGTKNFKEAFLDDFNALEKSGVITPENKEIFKRVENVRRYLNNLDKTKR